MTPEKVSPTAAHEAAAYKRPFPWSCSHCGRIEVQPAIVPYDIEVKHDGRLYNIHIPRLDVGRCVTCGELVFSNFSDDQISQALREHLGLLSPEEINRQLAALNLKQKDLAERIGVAPETVSRWLNSCQIQSRAMDNLMRIFFAFDNVREALSGASSDQKAGVATVPQTGGTSLPGITH